MKRLLRYLSAMAVVTMSVLFPLGSMASAQSNGLSVIPRRDFNVKAGEKISEELTITNLNKTEALQLKLITVDFNAKDENGTPNLVQDQNAKPTAWSLRPYFDLPQQVTVAPSKTTKIPLRINLPATIGAGSYYSAIEYASVNPQKPDQVTISASSATLVFVNIAGTAREQVSFQQFGAFVPTKDNSNGNFSSLFIDSQPTVLAYRLKNEGNLNEQPKGSIVIKNMFGKEVVTIADANPKDQLALLGQTRRFDVCVKGVTQKTKDEGGTEIESVVCTEPNLKPGRYTAQMSVFYGLSGAETREITAATSFWYLPWWFIAIVLVIAAAIAGITILIVFRIRKMLDKKTRRR